ncbi:hypothetical protein SDC9_108202 [bioreactor metagenome]|uniref:Uncharacterized protein n=1 Tax=bioreactor metagenome TaxID=1076179 RepID=A0A645BHX6_9ZZZZ
MRCTALSSGSGSKISSPFSMARLTSASSSRPWALSGRSGTALNSLPVPSISRWLAARSASSADCGSPSGACTTLPRPMVNCSGKIFFCTIISPSTAFSWRRTCVELSGVKFKTPQAREPRKQNSSSKHTGCSPARKIPASFSCNTAKAPDVCICCPPSTLTTNTIKQPGQKA